MSEETKRNIVHMHRAHAASFKQSYGGVSSMNEEHNEGPGLMFSPWFWWAGVAGLLGWTGLACLFIFA